MYAHLKELKKPIIPLKSLFVVSVVIFKATLDISYVILVAPHFSWTPSRYPLIPIPFKIFESYFLTFGLAILVPSLLRKPSDFLIVFHLLNPVIPSLSLYALANRAQSYTYMLCAAFALLILAVQLMPRIKVGSLRKGPVIAVSGSILGTTGALLLFMYLKHNVSPFAFNAFNIASLYQQRVTIVAALQKTGVLAYLAFWGSFVFTPFLIIWSLHSCRYKFLFPLFVLIQIFYFFYSARRSVFANLLLLLGTYILIKTKKRHALIFLLWVFITTVVSSTLIATTGGIFLPGSLLIERFLFTHARLNYAYYEFFSKAGFVHLTNVLPLGQRYPFTDIPERLVAKEILLSNSVASGGWLATSYMHFGYEGMIFFALIAGILLKITDSLIINRVSLEVGTPLAMVAFYSLFTSADLTTGLITYGIAPILLLLWLIGTKKSQSRIT